MAWRLHAIDATASAHRLIPHRCSLVNVGVFLRRRVLGHDVAYAEPLLTDFNPARVMSTLCRVHGHELLKDGLFNGDPSAARRP